jgi:Tetracyclin repressor-like, C-terminal domain
MTRATTPAKPPGRPRSGIHATVFAATLRTVDELGVGDAFAGVFSDALSDPALREVLARRLQDPYRLALQEALGEPEHRVLLFIDIVVGTLLHRMGMTGEPMVGPDIAALVKMVLAHFGD